MFKLLARLCKAILCPCCKRKITWSTQNIFEIADAIVGVPFGIPEKPQLPGESNMYIARIVNILHFNNPNLPLAVQKELQKLIHSTQCDCVLPGCDSLSPYRLFAALRKEHPTWKNIVCVTHADYLWLCALIAQEFGFELVVPTSVRSVPYNRHSSQKWTQSKWRFHGSFLSTRKAGIVMVLKGAIH